MRQTEIKYSCDNCGKQLKSYKNTLDIVTSLRETNPWARLHVNIIHRHGVHNDTNSEDAELCRACALTLLEDAIKRIKAGERTTAGSESIEQGEWK